MKKIRWIDVNTILMPVFGAAVWLKPNWGFGIFLAICVWVAIGYFWVGREIAPVDFPDLGEIDSEGSNK